MTVIAAIFFVGLVSAAGLFIETSALYVVKLRHQRAADLANLAASATPTPIVSGAASAEAQATARNVVAINGLTDATVVTKPAVGYSTGSALSTTVTRDMARLFPGLLGPLGPTTVPGNSTARIVASEQAGACVASLVGPVNIYNSAVVTGPACAAAAKTYLYVCNRASVSMQKVRVGYRAASESPYICASATMSPAKADFTYRAAPTDTIASHPDIIAIKKHLAAMGNPGWPYGTRSPASTMNPSVPPGQQNPTYTRTAAVLTQGVRYGTLTVTDSTLTFTGNGAPDPSCATPTTIAGNMILNGTNTLTFGSGCYVVGGYVLAKGAADTTFAAAPFADVTFVFKQYITNGTGPMRFPDATYSLNGDVRNESGGSLSFGRGKKVFGAGIKNGSGILSFLDGPHYVNGGTITNQVGTLTFGNGPFYLWGGSMSNASTGTMSYGNGPFYFYGGTVTNVRGSLILGNGPFYFQGGSLTLNSGSTTRFGIGDVDFYGGTISMGGDAMTFGYGGSASLGSGTVSLRGGSLSLTTRHLTAVGTTFAFSGGTVSLLGTGTITATAPTASHPTRGYRNILFVVLGGAFNLYQSAGEIDTMSGLIYVPVSNASIYGKQTVKYPAGGCFALVAGVVDIYQNAKLNFAPCTGLALGSTGGTPRLVQ